MTWTQVYDPMGSIWLSALLASLPILILFYALAVKKMVGYNGAFLALGVAVLTALVIWGMPGRLLLLSGLYGALFGLFPIGWIIVTALLLFNITVETGQFELIKGSVTRVCGDRRLQVLLIAFSFGTFLEGAAGFGAPVAISTAMLVSLGFEPFRAAALSLMANTAPVAFAGFGIPVITLAGVTGLNLRDLSAMVGRQLPLLSLILPAWLVIILSGWRGLCGVLPAVLVSGVSFAVVQWYTSNYLGPYLPDMLSALISAVALVLLLRFWRPAKVWRFPEENNEPQDGLTAEGLDPRRLIKAWTPFLLLTLIVLLWNVSPIKGMLETVTLRFPIPGLDGSISRIPPVAAAREIYPALYNLNWLSAPGTALLLTALIAMRLLGIKPATGLRLFGTTVGRLWSPLLTIITVLALAFIMNYSGMSVTLALALTKTGRAFPFFAPLLGWLGVFLTGSDTSSNALFGKLQTITASQIGASPTLMAAANTSGGVTGKMISPQSIAVATASAGLAGREGSLFRTTVGHSIVMAFVISLITILQAYLLPWMIP